MTSRFRTYAAAHATAFVRKDRGTAGLRLCAETALVSRFFYTALFIIYLSAFSTAWAATPPRTIISNTATLTYSDGLSSGIISVLSNSTSVSTVLPRTPATIELLQHAPSAANAQLTMISPTAYRQGATGIFTLLGPPVPAGSTTPLDLAVPVPLVTAGQYHTGEPVFIRLVDLDQNMDPGAAESVIVTLRDDKSGDQEVLLLTETGPDTGVFTGYIQSSSSSGSAGNGLISVTSDSSISATYVDVQDGTGAVARALVDPFGKIFSTANGQPLDGLTVTLINEGTGLPALVYGDDGVSAYPPTVTSGGTASDSSGALYIFPPGEYRFPYIQPGQYRLQVAVPQGQKAPSTVSTAAIQTLPGGPFALVDPGSRGEVFTVNAGPAIHIDIPVDQVTGRLYLIKTSGKTVAAQGDFVPYHLTVENIDTTYPVLDVAVSDKLPHGFRFRKGSTKINGSPSADPSLSDDGRTLLFRAGDIQIGGKAEITYVAEVTVGAVAGKATNYAVATGIGDAFSNTAAATVEVRDAFFTDKSTIAGRILVDGCGDQDKSEEGGLAGVRIYLEDGTFTISDKNGMYHFEGVTPGTHVVQLDSVSIPEKYEIMACEENTRFAGSAFSQFADLQGGTLWRADFHLGLKPETEGEVGIELRTFLKKGTSDGSESSSEKRKDIIEYELPIHVGAVPARNARISVLLPEGAIYRPGSSTMNAVPMADPDVNEGTVTYRIEEAPANWEATLRFDAEIPVAGRTGSFSTGAVMHLNTPKARNERTPMVDNAIVRHLVEERKSQPDIVLHPQFGSGSADLSGKDRRELDKLINDLRKVYVKHLTVVGHTDSQVLSSRLGKKFSDNHGLSLARAKSIGSYIAAALNLSPEQMTYGGKGPDEPVADNRTSAGRAKNRRVELKVESQRIVIVSEIKQTKDASGMKAKATMGLRPGEQWLQEEKKSEVQKKDMPEYNAAWLEAAQPGVAAILWPPENHYPSIPSTRIAVQHSPKVKPKLFLNEEEVNPIYFEGTLQKKDGKTAVSHWIGVGLKEGDNVLDVELYDESSRESARLTRSIHYSTDPVKAELVPARSKLFADGKTSPAIAVRLTDRDGHPVPEGVLGEYSVDAPHVARQRAEDLKNNPLTASSSVHLQFKAGENGIAVIELQPTTMSGEAVLRFNLMSGEQEVRAWLKPESRDWVLVGLAEGTLGYNVVNGNMESLSAAGGEDELYQDGRAAFYAKGRIKGEWLLTMAYDSAKKGNRESLYQTIDPSRYYLLYGDASEQLYDAASAKRLYLKIERNQFYALFGDFQTGLTVTELTRYSRNFTGLKSEMKTDAYEYNVFVSETNQAFVRDEIRGEGTSGLYLLSRKNIILNSETVTIETRDRFKSEVVVSTQRLVRFLDYTIDYETGSIWFKSPVSGYGAGFNPVYIIVAYESFDAADTSYNYGGRGAFPLLENRLQAGVTHVHEGRVGGEGNLTGIDVTYKFDDKTRIRTEVASSRIDALGVVNEKNAYLAEVLHTSSVMDGKVYVREQDDGFGLGQLSGSEAGTRKTGFDIAYRMNGPWSLGGEAFRQENLGTGAVRDMVQVRGGHVQKMYQVSGGLLHAEDRFGTGEMQSSDQVFVEGRYRFTERLTSRMRIDQSLFSNNENADFPSRATLGFDYELNKTATLFVDQERTWGASEDSSATRLGMRASPWSGGQLNSTVEQQSRENGVRLFSTSGLKQSWQVSKTWSMDAGMERAVTIRHPGNTDINVNVPAAFGSAMDYTALSVGSGYRGDKWSWTGRIEMRESEIDRKNGIMTGASGEVRDGVGIGGGIQWFRTTALTGTENINGDLRLGLAYRPVTSRWIILDRIDYLVTEQRSLDTAASDNRRIVNNLVMNYTVPGLGQVSFMNGIKYVRETIDSSEYRGYTMLLGLEGRYDLTRKWDAGLRILMLDSLAVSDVKYGSGISVGYNMAKNIGISAGYNISGFRDRDFSRADFTAEGPFVKFRMKFNQVSAQEAVKWFIGL